MKPRQFLRCRSFWFRCFRGPPLPWGHTSWHRFHRRARARIHIHTSFFHAPPPFFQRVFTFAICFISFLFFLYEYYITNRFPLWKVFMLFVFFFGWFASHTSKIICFFAKMSFSLHRFGFALPFYFVKQTARCTKFGLVRATTTHF